MTDDEEFEREKRIKRFELLKKQKEDLHSLLMSTMSGIVASYLVGRYGGSLRFLKEDRPLAPETKGPTDAVFAKLGIPTEED